MKKPANSGPFSTVSAKRQNSGLGGGPDRDRTWDPYHVNALALTETTAKFTAGTTCGLYSGPGILDHPVRPVGGGETMPRRSSGPRLWFDKQRQTWTILDGRRRHRTGCSAADTKGAENALREYITRKHKPAKTEAPLIADIVAAYADEQIRHVISGKHISYDLERLTGWWGTKQTADVDASSVRAYIAARNAPGCARRELAFLNAAVSHWRANHAPTMAAPKIKLPPKPAPRQHFMTRSQAAKFLWPLAGHRTCEVLSHRVVHRFKA
jgi:hypothetical protein